MDRPEISFIVVNWNGKDYLGECIEAINSQSRQDFEIILVDNASTDGSVENVEARWPGVRLIKLDTNTGFAFANNFGANQAKGKWLALVNNDAFLAPDWMEQMLEAAELNPEYSFFASRLMRTSEPQILEASGDICHVSCHAWHRDQNQPVERAQRETDEVFSPSAAAALYHKEQFLEVEGFDERYFSHHEDVDLGFRLRLRGYRCLYVPDAVARHIGSASFGVESNRTVYQVHRNTVWTYFKNMPAGLLWKYLFAHLVSSLVFLIYYTLRGQWKAIWLANFDALRGLPAIFHQRKVIQDSRQIDASDLLNVLDRSWLGPYTLGSHAKGLKHIARILGIDSNP